MDFYGDYHTHTFYSDSTNTVKGVLQAARDRGLKEIAITDHGYCNKWLSLTPRKFAREKKRIEKYRGLFPELKIYQGIEADIIDSRGTVDMQPNELMNTDILLCGFHRFVDSTCYKDYFRFVLYNGFFVSVFKPTAEKIEMNTNAYVQAIKNYPIDVLTHVNNRAKVDVKKVCETAAEYGTMIEINMKHLELVDGIIGDMLKTDCTFIVNTDAHLLRDVGNFSDFMPLLDKYNIPEERIANYKKAPVFTRLNEYKARMKNGQAQL